MATSSGQVGTPKDAKAAPMAPWQRRLARRSRL